MYVHVCIMSKQSVHLCTHLVLSLHKHLDVVWCQVVQHVVRIQSLSVQNMNMRGYRQICTCIHVCMCMIYVHVIRIQRLRVQNVWEVAGRYSEFFHPMPLYLPILYIWHNFPVPNVLYQLWHCTYTCTQHTYNYAHT